MSLRMTRVTQSSGRATRSPRLRNRSPAPVPHKMFSSIRFSDDRAFGMSLPSVGLIVFHILSVR